ncbi:MAG: hypothetical protein K9H14_06025 [Actinomycetia bacterium]|nr:hypothetical protein [Actinomycetes bacterium]
MNRRFTGVIFCFISSFLFSARYITAAIFANGITSWNKELFESMLQYTGNALLVISIISLATGVIYLIAGEFEGRKNK